MVARPIMCFTSKVRNLFLVRSPIDHFVSQIWGIDAIPKHAELVARLHWPDEHANVVLVSVGVDRHVRCSLLQILRMWIFERKEGKMDGCHKHLGEYLSRVCRSSNRPAAHIQVIASPLCVHLDRWSNCDICAAQAGTRFTFKGVSSQTGIFCIQVMLANMLIPETSLS